MSRFTVRALIIGSALWAGTVVVALVVRQRQASQPSWAQMLRDADAGRLSSLRLEPRPEWWRSATDALHLPFRSPVGLHPVFVVTYRPSAPGRPAPEYELAEPRIPNDDINDDLRRVVRDGVRFETWCGTLR